jgi:hypothetical protein
MRIITEKHARTFQLLDQLEMEESTERKEPSTMTSVVTDLVKEGVEAVQSLVAPVVAPVVAPAESPAEPPIEASMADATSSEEMAINKANAVLEAPIPAPVVPESGGTTIVIEQGSAPVKVESTVAEQVAPAEEAKPAEQAEGSAPLVLQPQAGGAPAQPRKKIHWNGAEQARPGPDEHVTVLKIG